MSDEKREVTAFAIGPADTDFEGGVYPVVIPQLNKHVQVLVVHSSQWKEPLDEGWHFSLGTSSEKTHGVFSTAKDAFFAALDLLAKEAIELKEQEIPANTTLH